MDQDNAVSSSTGDAGHQEQQAADLPLQSAEVSTSGQPATMEDWFGRLRYEAEMTEIGWSWSGNPPVELSDDSDSEASDTGEEIVEVSTSDSEEENAQRRRN